jgi:hypothetical protein
MATQRLQVGIPLLATSSLPPRSPPPTDPVCTPEDEAAKKELKEETERQSWFQNEVNDRLDIPNGYLKVNVLIIRWHEDIDEFDGHNEEVSIQ